MSCLNTKELEQMLEDVVNKLDLSNSALTKHEQIGTPPAELVRIVFDEKESTIRALIAGMRNI
jgi:hypothetical protein